MTDRPRLISASDVASPRAGWRPLRAAVCGRGSRAIDLMILCGAALVVFALPHWVLPRETLGSLFALRVPVGSVMLGAASVAGWWAMLNGAGLYGEQRKRSLAEYSFRCIIGLNGCTLLAACTGLMLHWRGDLWTGVQTFWAVCLCSMFVARVGLFLFCEHVWPKFKPSRNLIIVGSGARAQQIHQEFKLQAHWNYHLLGFVDSQPQNDYVPASLMMGGVEDLERILMHNIVDEVVIALPIKSQYEAVDYTISLCQSLGIQSHYFANYFGTASAERNSSAAGGPGRVTFAVASAGFRCSIKRLLDVVGSLALLAVLSPVMLAVALAVRLSSPGPILFRQQRYGLNKRLFPMLKFRSMTVDAEARQAAIEHLNETSGPVFKIKDDPRITPLGGFLRRFSLDELPQLFNVLAGQMSLVGPRPLPLRDVHRFSEAWLMRRFSVKPGITCLWQVMGRSNTEFDRWIELDLHYIDNWSLSLDVQILFRTIPAVIFSHGAS